MAIKFRYPEGATPLDEDHKNELIPSLSTLAELNEFEQFNIGLALMWASKSRKLKQNRRRIIWDSIKVLKKYITLIKLLKN